MPPTPSRIAEDLRGQLVGEVLSDDLSRRLYASDGSIYELTPSVVVRPRTTADVLATVGYAAREELPVHARGAGSGLAGGCLGRGIVIDFSRFMRRLIEDDGETVRVQAGMVHAELNRRLAPSGRMFAPDPEMSESTTLGGMVGVNASGSRRPLYGATSDHVVSVRGVTAEGSVVWFDRPSAAASKGARDGDPADLHAKRLATSVGALLTQRAEVIQEKTPRGAVNSSGYALDQVLADGSIDLGRLMVGSEGTLALITEVRVQTTPLPRHVGGMLLVFASLDRAAQAAQVIAPMGLAACDLMDRRHLGLAREIDPRYEVLLSGAAEAVLYVELVGESQDEIALAAERITAAVRGDEPLAAEALVAETPEDLQLYRDLSHKFVATLHGLRGNRRASPGVEDVAVPPTALPQFFRRLQEILKRRQITASLFGHAAHGQVHVRPLLDFSSPTELRKLEALAGDLYDTVWLLGGTMSGAHGDGLSRTPFTSRQHGPLVNVFREVKRLFDPAGILNPGKVVPSPGVRMTHNARRVSPATKVLDQSSKDEGLAEEKPVVALQLDWTAEEAAEAARECNGCSACRSRGPDVRMCPIFRYTPREEASPRAKANLLRGVITGELPEDALLRDESKRVADLCVHCHQCRLDCPAEVDIPKMMVEAKAAYVKTNGMPIDLWWATNLDRSAKLLSLLPRLANAMFASPRVRWLMERTVGLSARRKLPRLANRPYLRKASIKKLGRPVADNEDRVVYFVDTYANHFDTELATAFQRILLRHEVGLYVPSSQAESGMSHIAQGALDAAQVIAERNVQMLAEAVRQGHTVVATEPAAVLALTHEYPQLMPGDEDALLVAENTYEACHYLWKRHLEAQLMLDMEPLPYRVACHVPCHLRALGVGVPSENLLRLIPELRAERVDKGCSGMAGTYGLLRRNYRASLRAGLPLLSTLRSGEYQLGATECGACRTQMEQNSPIPTLHPIKLLAASYGLMPKVQERLQRLPPLDPSAGSTS